MIWLPNLSACLPVPLSHLLLPQKQGLACLVLHSGPRAEEAFKDSLMSGCTSVDAEKMCLRLLGLERGSKEQAIWLGWVVSAPGSGRRACLAAAGCTCPPATFTPEGRPTWGWSFLGHTPHRRWGPAPESSQQSCPLGEPEPHFSDQETKVQRGSGTSVERGCGADSAQVLWLHEQPGAPHAVGPLYLWHHLSLFTSQVDT